MFGDTAGKQCACCSLYAICFTTVRSPGHWNIDDLDFIVKEGDTLYTSLNKNTYLMVSDLPQNILLFGSDIKVTYLENDFGFLNSTSVGFLSGENILSTGSGALLFIKGACISVICKKNAVFLFLTVEIIWVKQYQMAFQC